MSFRDTVLMNAFDEAGKPVHWAKHEDRILEYFAVSTGRSWTKEEALEISWCSYFVHWCLVRGGMQPLPAVGTSAQLGKMGSVGRFIRQFGGVYPGLPVVGPAAYRPRPGDMYYRPMPHDHIGLIAEVGAASGRTYQIRTIDGNSGPEGFSPLFDMTSGDGVHKIGYGFIYQPTEWKTLDNTCWYVRLCDYD
jgi:hypothetical protein